MPMPVPVPLPEGVRAQSFTYARGQTVTVYRAPVAIEGPTQFRDERGRLVWVFLYAHFVFAWAEGAATVDISHGHLPGHPTGDRLVRYRGIPIEGRWCADTLARFGRAWATDPINRHTHR